MKITIDRKALADAAADAMQFVPVKPKLPILNNFKFTTKGNRLKLEANDDKRSFLRYITVSECDADGGFLVDSDSFSRFIAKTKGESLVLNIDAETLTVSYPKGKADFQLIPVSEYPAFDVAGDNVQKVSVPASILLDCITSANGFVGDDDYRPMMKAIYAYIKEGQFGYSASDTRILINDHQPVDVDAAVDIHWYIEPSVFSAVAKACKAAETAEITIAPTAVSYRIGNTVVQSAQTQSRYPDIRRIIPDRFAMTCAVSKTELEDSLSRVSLFCEEARCIKIGIGQKDMTISAEDNVMIRKCSETMQNNGCNGECTIGINADLLKRCLAPCKEDEVTWHIKDAAAPVVMKQESRPNTTILIMPMTLKNN